MAKGGRRLHSGRHKKPTTMKLVQNTFREDRHGSEVQVESMWPEAPANLNERERSLWKQLEDRCNAWVAPSDWLAINGVVSLTDRLLRVQEAQRETEGAGGPLAFKYTPSADGEPNLEPKENPLYTLEMKLWRELRAFIGIVGLSPVDRARVQKSAAEPAAANPLDRFIKKAR